MSGVGNRRKFILSICGIILLILLIVWLTEILYYFHTRTRLD